MVHLLLDWATAWVTWFAIYGQGALAQSLGVACLPLRKGWASHRR
jgi:hypothetical protein